MHFDIKHTFSKQEARRRVEAMVADVRGKIGDKATIDEERWEGDRLHFALTAQGQQVEGQVAVNDSSYEIDVKLPLMLRLFEGRIQKQIEEQMRQGLKG